MQTQSEIAQKAFLSDRQVGERYSVSRQTPWTWYKKKKLGFPAPISLSPGCTRWCLADLEAWENSQKSAAQ